MWFALYHKEACSSVSSMCHDFLACSSWAWVCNFLSGSEPSVTYPSSIFLCNYSVSLGFCTWYYWIKVIVSLMFKTHCHIWWKNPDQSIFSITSLKFPIYLPSHTFNIFEQMITCMHMGIMFEHIFKQFNNVEIFLFSPN